MYVIQGLAQTAKSYEVSIKCLKDHYDRSRVTQHEHVRSIFQDIIMKGNNGKDLCKLDDVCRQHIRVIQLCKSFDSETFLTIAMELKMDKVMRLKWMEYSNDSLTTSQYSRLLKFLNMQALHFDSVSSEQKPQTITHRSYAATLKKVCMACGSRGNHPLGAYSNFQDISQEKQ